MSMNSFHSRSHRAPPKRSRDAAATTRPAGLQRLDALLVAQGRVESRTRARQLIEAGRVSCDEGVIVKPGHLLPESARLTVAEDEQGRFVSRGALKLAAALEQSGLDVRGATCLDIGQSTGGFTDCLLQAGAARVVGVEVGHGQLHPRLRENPRCITLEGINARHLVAADLGPNMPPQGFDLIVCDTSFISLTLLMPQWPALLAPSGQIVALVKPQFEVGPEGIGKGGVVRDEALYETVERTIRLAAQELGLAVRGWYESPLKGGGVGNIEGNREFLIWMQHQHDDQD